MVDGWPEVFHVIDVTGNYSAFFIGCTKADSLHLFITFLCNQYASLKCAANTTML